MKCSALLVSDSGLWGVWCYRALRKAGFILEPILAKDIEESFEQMYAALFVPGGWSMNKLSSLDQKGCAIIKRAVEAGCAYVGICGGASLAIENGLGLFKIKRAKERVPSYSGLFVADIKPDHPLFWKIKRPIFYLWYPPSLILEDNKLSLLATFAKAHPLAYTSDLPWQDFKGELPEWEKLYRINLDPQRMKGMPVLIEGERGKGKIILSLIHFDTPKHRQGEILLLNLLKYLGLEAKKDKKHSLSSRALPKKFTEDLRRRTVKHYAKLLREVKELVDFGLRNFLFTKREPYIYRWRRGIRGLEPQNFLIMLEEIVRLLWQATPESLEKIQVLQPDPEEFNLILEALRRNYAEARFWLQSGTKSTLGNAKATESSDEPQIFGSNVKSYGGIYRKVINALEEVLVVLWRDEL